MKTIIITNVKNFEHFETDSTSEEIEEYLAKKGNFIHINKINFNKTKERILLRKTAIRLVKSKPAV